MWWIKKEANQGKLFAEIDEERQRFRKYYQSQQWKRTKQLHYLDPINQLCAMCLVSGLTTIHTSIDHIQPLWLRWDLRNDLTNLQSLCDYHHYTIKRKQEEEMKKQMEIENEMNKLNKF